MKTGVLDKYKSIAILGASLMDSNIGSATLHKKHSKTISIPHTPKQIKARAASKRARKARKISRPTY